MVLGGITSQNIQDELKDFTDNSDVDEATKLLQKAIEIAVNNGKNSFSYVWGITKRWYNSGIFTIEALEAEEKSEPLAKDMEIQLKKKSLKTGATVQDE
ncbi:DnaD domain protein [Leuconostoc litchii]|uniref:DnaD domain protein n=1 Tax=Leuconostoc litchii TaxID=1981069 RepID=UPI0024E0835E|nr:DnaD domain protein [Leuconostoc litchii]